MTGSDTDKVSYFPTINKIEFVTTPGYSRPLMNYAESRFLEPFPQNTLNYF